MRFAAEEAARLGLALGFHNCPGWSSSGGPWVPPEHSMQKLVWSEASARGPGSAELVLARPSVDKRWDYYRDVAMLAVPATAAGPEAIVDLSAQMDATGRVRWDVPD